MSVSCHRLPPRLPSWNKLNTVQHCAIILHRNSGWRLNVKAVELLTRPSTAKNCANCNPSFITNSLYCCYCYKLSLTATNHISLQKLERLLCCKADDTQCRFRRRKSAPVGAESRRRSSFVAGRRRPATKINRRIRKRTGAGRLRSAPDWYDTQSRNRRRFSAPTFGAEIWTVCHRLKLCQALKHLAN